MRPAHVQEAAARLGGALGESATVALLQQLVNPHPPPTISAEGKGKAGYASPLKKIAPAPSIGTLPPPLAPQAKSAPTTPNGSLRVVRASQPSSKKAAPLNGVTSGAAGVGGQPLAAAPPPHWEGERPTTSSPLAEKLRFLGLDAEATEQQETAFRPVEVFGGPIGEYLSKGGYIAYNGSAEGWRCLLESICIGISGYSHKPFIAELITLMIHAGRTLKRMADAREFRWAGNGSRHAEGPDSNDYEWNGLSEIFGIDPDGLDRAISDLTKIQTMNRMLEAPVFALASMVLHNSAFEAILPTPVGTLQIDGYLAGCNSRDARIQRLAVAGDNIIRSTVRGEHYYGFRKATAPIMPIAELMGCLMSKDEVRAFITGILDGPQGSACRRSGPSWKAPVPQPAQAGGGGGPGKAAAASKPQAGGGGGGPGKSKKKARTTYAAAVTSTAAAKSTAAGKAAAASGGGGARASAAAPPQPPTEQDPARPAGPGPGAGAPSSNNEDSARNYLDVVTETH